MEKVSFLVLTKDRKESFLKCIDSINKQSYPNKEILISDQSTGECYTQEFDNVYRVDGPLDDCYRTLVNNATGDYCVFVEDDDYFVDEHLFRDIIPIFKDDTGCLVYNYWAPKMHDKESQEEKMERMARYSSEEVLVFEWFAFFRAFPIVMKGHYQFSSTVFRTNILQRTFKQFLWNDMVNMCYNDEFIFLCYLVASEMKVKKIETIGYILGIGDDNFSWNNIYNLLYGGHMYIQRCIQWFFFAFNCKGGKLQWKEEMEIIHIKHCDYILPDVSNYFEDFEFIREKYLETMDITERNKMIQEYIDEKNI